LGETGQHSKSSIRILLVDDHSLFRAGIASLLSSREDMEVVGEAQDGRQALEAARELKPDLVLMDVHMPNLGGIEATRQIRAELPETRVVMLTVSDQDRDLFEAIKNGASGYLLKNLEPDELFGYLTGVFRGEAPISRTMAAKILTEFSSQASRPRPGQPDGPLSELTPREREVLKLVAVGASNRDIASALTLTENTVKNHLRNILDKLHLENRVQAATYALRMGLGEETD
jgi:two-component system, NarL family, nitrate/nitrite response regulator NarL